MCNFCEFSFCGIISCPDRSAKKMESIKTITWVVIVKYTRTCLRVWQTFNLFSVIGISSQLFSISVFLWPCADLFCPIEVFCYLLQIFLMFFLWDIRIIYQFSNIWVFTLQYWFLFFFKYIIIMCDSCRATGFSSSFLWSHFRDSRRSLNSFEILQLIL